MSKAISRIQSVVVIVVILIAAVVGVYAFSQKSSSTTRTSSSQTTSTTSAISQSSSSSSSSSSASSSSSSSSSSASSIKSTIIIGTTDQVPSLDPGAATGYFSTTVVLPNIGSSLVQYNPFKNAIVPDLATNWTISSDGLTYTFNLRNDAKFSNGDPITAQTVIESWKRVFNLSTNAFLLSPPLNETDPNAMVAPNNYTLILHLESAFTPFLTVIAISGAATDIVDPKIVNMTGAFAGNYIGSGPYMIKSWTQGVELNLVPNPLYYGTPPITQNIDLKFFTDSTTLALAVKSGQVDVAYRFLLPSDVHSFVQSNSSATSPKVYEGTGTTPRFIALDTAIAPFNNSLVRQALEFSINRTTLISSLFEGTVSPDYSIIPPGVFGYYPAYQNLYGSDGNLTKARELLTQAGYSSTNPLKFNMLYTPSSYGDTEESAATIIQQEFESTGMIIVTLQSAEFATYINLFLSQKNPNIPAVMDGWPPSYVDPNDYLSAVYSSSISAELAIWYNSTQVDNLLSQEAGASNLTLRQSIIVQIQNITAPIAPIVPLWAENEIIVAQPNVTGVTTNADGIFPFGALSAPLS